MTDTTPGIAGGRLDPERLAANFADIAPTLERPAALVEAERCLYCYDAPCSQACPTHIDVPAFIQKIRSDNLKGAAREILSANVLGGACARVCPTEILCEGSCVRHGMGEAPVRIGALQRYATDWVIDAGLPLFERAPDSGARIAVVGAGPAGLACAHTLARAGHRVTVFDARRRAGGLNEYGIAAYKMADDFARREIDYLLSIGNIEIEAERTLGADLSLGALRRDYDAVFLGLGLGGVKALDAEGEHLDGVLNAVDFIAGLRQSEDLGQVAVGRRVVVIGGGNTAIDAAVQSRRLGAEQVTLVYRRGQESMSATADEQAFARLNGVEIRLWSRPARLLGEQGRLSAVVLETTEPRGGELVASGETVTVAADMVLKAIGQSWLPLPLDGEQLSMWRGKIETDADGRTSIPGVWAGGDCTASGQYDLTVQAVADGQRAGRSIDQTLSARRRDAA
jgi:glutamate synthase (NADPH/NADH) small chain